MAETIYAEAPSLRKSKESPKYSTETLEKSSKKRTEILLLALFCLLYLKSRFFFTRKMNALLLNPEKWLGLSYEDGKGFVLGLRSGGFEALEKVKELKKEEKFLKKLIPIMLKDVQRNLLILS